MNSHFGWKYVLLGVAAFLVVLVVVYLQVSSTFHVPLLSLLPSNPFSTHGPVPVSKESAAPVQRVRLDTGTVVYVVTGKFVSNLAYNAQNLLQGEFVIDTDPTTHKILVVLTRKTDKITVARSQGSFDGKTVVAPESMETLRQQITVGAPVQLKIYTVGSTKPPSILAEEKVLDGIIAGNWSVQDTFALHPLMVGVVD